MTKTKRVVGANPIPRILFMGMTMQAWVKYTHNTIEKMNAAKENGVEYIESESDEDDYTFMDPDASQDSRSPDDSASDPDDDRTKLNGYIKEEEEDQSDEEGEKERINTEQQSLIDIDPTERKLKQEGEEKDYIFNGDISPMAAYDEENAGNYNAANMALRSKFKRAQRNHDGTKITITSHSSIKGGSHFELDKKASASRLTPQRLVKFVEGGDLADLPPKASYSFLEPDMSPKKFESNKSSKSNLGEGDKNNVINFNINNNVVINNNYFINAAPGNENAEIGGALSPISRETSITIERNINISRGQPQQQAARPLGSRQERAMPIFNSRGELNEEGALAIPGSTGSKDTPTSKKSDSK